MMAVANRIPKPNEIAIGMMYCACKESSKMSGMRPPKVVSVSKQDRSESPHSCLRDGFEG